jgi:hypothetical protein
MKILRNAWLNIFLAVLTIAVPIAFYFGTRPVKRLRVEILSNSPLVSVNTAMAKEMQILYKGKPVQALSLILLKFANVGNEPIKESDYSEPIRILMSQSAGVGEVSVQESRPDGIRLIPTVIASNEVELARVLFNPGDQAVLKILALNNDSTLKITARIVGISTLDIQSVLARNDTMSGRFADFIPYLLISSLVLLLAGFRVWRSRPVTKWRMKQFGFNPPRYYYTLAQSGMLTLPGSKDSAEASNALARVIGNLDQCFAWDSTYVERVMNDPIFVHLLSYERFRHLIQKYNAGHGGSGESEG